MTQEHLKLYDAAFEAKVDYKPHSETEHFSEYFEHGFRVGGRAILDNPGEWGLVRQGSFNKKELLKNAWKERAEKYREALERIVDQYEDFDPSPYREAVLYKIAKEALKQQ